jgi:chromosome segregation ATPase
MLAETRTALEASRTQVIEQTRLIEETSMKLQELQTAYDCMNQTSKSREKEVYSLQAALAAADMDAQMAQAKLKEKSRQISELDESETSLRGTVIELQKKMEESQKSMDSEIRELTQDLEASQLHIQTLEKELETSKHKYEKLQDQSNHGWAEERKYLVHKVKDMQEKLEDAEARAQGHMESVEGTGPLGKEARARTLSQKLQDAEDTILHLTQEVASLKTQIKSRDETLATVRNQMAMEVTDAAQQVQELVAAQARAEDLERQLAKIRRQHGSHA